MLPTDTDLLLRRPSEAGAALGRLHPLWEGVIGPLPGVESEIKGPVQFLTFESLLSFVIINAFSGLQRSKGANSVYVQCARPCGLVSPDVHGGQGPEGAPSPGSQAHVCRLGGGQHEKQNPASEGGGRGREGDGNESLPAGPWYLLAKTLGLRKAQTPPWQRRLTLLLWREPCKSGLRLEAIWNCLRALGPSGPTWESRLHCSVVESLRGAASGTLRDWGEAGPQCWQGPQEHATQLLFSEKLRLSCPAPG